MITQDLQAVKAAEQAGCYGAVWCGDEPLPTAALTVRQARDFIDAPRVMVRDAGQCWHGQS